MTKIRVGNKQNSFINGEWAGHVRGFFKKYTSSKRRRLEKKEILKAIKDHYKGELKQD